jgi:hypothetical protein
MGVIFRSGISGKKSAIYKLMKLYEEIFRIYQLLSESENSDVLHVPSLSIFSPPVSYFSIFSVERRWELLQEFLIKMGNPKFSLGGSLYLGKNQKIENLGGLVSLKGNLTLQDSDLKSFGDLEKIGGSLSITNSDIRNLDNIRLVSDDLKINDQKMDSLGNLEYVGGDLFFDNVSLNDLNNLEFVGGDCIIHSSPLKNIGKLKTVGGSLSLGSTPIYKNKKMKDVISSQVKSRGGIFFYK